MVWRTGRPYAAAAGFGGACGGKNTLAFAAEKLIVENQDHCWADERWRWHSGEEWPSESVRNGTAGDEERSAQASAALAEGRFDDVLALYGIGWDKYLAQVLHGLPLNMGDAVHCDDWREELVRLMANLAPWRLAKAVLQGKTPPAPAAVFRPATSE